MSQSGDAAWQDFSQGKYRVALNKFKALVSTEAENARVHIGLACCYGMLNRPESAIKEALRALELDQSSADSHVILADVYRQMHNYDESKREAQEALELDPNSAHAHAMLGLLLLDKKQFQEAIDHYKIAIATEQSNSLYHINLAIAYQKMGHNAAAVKQYRNALRLSHSFANISKVILSYIGYYRWLLAVFLLSIFVVRSIYTLPLMLVAACYMVLWAWFYLRHGKYMKSIGSIVLLLVVIAFYVYHLLYGL